MLLNHQQIISAYNTKALNRLAIAIQGRPVIQMPVKTKQKRKSEDVY